MFKKDRSLHSMTKGTGAGALLRGAVAVFCWMSVCGGLCQAGILKQQDYSVQDRADRAIANFLKQREIRDIYAWRDWMTHNISYAKDFRGDDWSSPMQTLKRGFGDCEDFAILNCAVLRVLGNTADLYVVERWGLTHAVCIFRYEIGGTLYWGYTDNDRFVITEQSDFKQFTRQLMEANGYSGLTRYAQRLVKKSTS